MRNTGIVMLLIGLVLAGYDIVNGIKGSYRYELKYAAYWDLADKASTIPQKAENIDKFVKALEAGGFTGKYNAIWLKTPNNSFDANMIALKSLQQRLHDIEMMDIKSFEYQTAIQQITQQEQGEADEMLGVFKGIWWKENHILLWDWVCFFNIMLVILFISIGGTLWVDAY